MSGRERCEVVVVGAGIAGASVAYHLAARGRADVVVLEREEQPGMHATGRSAATFVALDTNPTLHALKALSLPFLRDPPAGFCETPLLRPTGTLMLLREPALGGLRAAAPYLRDRGMRIELLGPREACDLVDCLVPGEMDGAVLVPDDGHIEVHELLSACLANARRAGAEVRCGVEVTGLIVERGRCAGVRTASGDVRARWVVDAAGAWAPVVGRMAGASPIELRAHRRHLVTFAAPPGRDPSRWPLVWSDAHRIYFAPESGGLKMSPMDEEPMDACDARPDAMVVAEGIERLRALAPEIVPGVLRRSWAGLRTFAPDRVPVVGEDPALPGFFWLAGQGGCGIETSPILGAVAADLIASGRTDRFDATALSPGRFRGG